MRDFFSLSMEYGPEYMYDGTISLIENVANWNIAK